MSPSIPEAAPVRVLYLAVGPAPLYQQVRRHLFAGIELATLETGSVDEIHSHLPNCDVVIVATRKFDSSMIEAATRLRLVVHQGVGYHDTVDVQALRARGVALAITPDGTATAVAEHAVMLMLATCRHLAFADAELRAGHFHVNALRLRSRTLAGKTIGYVGMGRIGQATASRLRGWDTLGVYADPVPLSPEREAALGLERVGLDQLLARADIVSLHLPLTETTRGLIDASAFARMRDGVVLINTARGPIVDEAALLEALDSGRLGGAGLDVFTREPLEAPHALARHSNVVLTPHIAAATRDTFDAKMHGVFANIRRFCSGQALHDQVF